VRRRLHYRPSISVGPNSAKAHKLTSERKFKFTSKVFRYVANGVELLTAIARGRRHMVHSDNLLSALLELEETLL